MIKCPKKEENTAIKIEIGIFDKPGVDEFWMIKFGYEQIS